MERRTLYQAAVLIAAVLISLSAGFIGSIFTEPAIPGWYAQLEKPPFTPPEWAFGPVWTTLYILMGISVFLIWRAGWQRRDVRYGIGLFGLQLAVNALWSYLFFGLQSPLLGLIDIVALWVLLLVTILWFARISRAAAALLVPYILWVTIATYLNAGIFLLN
ncbi:MAG: tryptophan-rich sensory protein [Methanomicrobiaceae archaeon]|uniref:Benzodiazepine receptor tspo n=1 Tax=hydrocarbon metagenome TaxID=938273 RepID=A0A0W8FFW9_9ZZZZ|nr:tryptophan-rich sensory protein [Methanomicrobiaceae archaeon]MDD5420181.1 tryptophan-rich sensory protein [Methanomicrobiaceae archaeon]